MKISTEQFERIEKYFPVQQGNAKISNYDFINAILYIAENGCKWRTLPKDTAIGTAYTSDLTDGLKMA